MYFQYNTQSKTTFGQWFSTAEDSKQKTPMQEIKNKIISCEQLKHVLLLERTCKNSSIWKCCLLDTARTKTPNWKGIRFWKDGSLTKFEGKTSELRKSMRHYGHLQQMCCAPWTALWDWAVVLIGIIGPVRHRLPLLPHHVSASFGGWDRQAFYGLVSDCMSGTSEQCLGKLF